ncbi:MAG: hypothetical protein N3A64_00375, partial [Desulfobacterota bacterium]|nr:hypothetical protein [Thermodesulfobacteriota bacterium]
MAIHRDFELILRENGLDNFDALMNLNKGRVIKQKTKNRSTVCFSLAQNQKRYLCYLKRYRFSWIKEFFRNCLFFFRTYSLQNEWKNLLTFKRSGIPTMIPIAVGVRRKFPFWNESFLLTLGIPAVKTLEEVLPDYFFSPQDSTRLKQKRILIKNLAQLTKRMHNAGFRHQDFYLCHILIDLTNNPASPLLYVADLHRAKKRRFFQLKGQIKDLAALNYSAPSNLISRSDRLRFLKEYD